jgi:hypothetical protein
LKNKIQILEFVLDKIEVGTKRASLCTSILVIEQRKMSLVQALYGRRPWPDLESSMDGHGELAGEGREGEEGGGEQGARCP